ncbi:oligopeptide transport system permease protein [Dongia mobilis]|uniref:Oligopeptide transport system permease protein OppC n=1 Tax=Dongia mobilis TaxID=578943 RepID=A0A4R6WR16_9PROT|nr:ABC transporter permease subunit [Dongia mobilis]TDQ84042.1 oligopeptide transport system permease protein [Dongia mobilis]
MTDAAMVSPRGEVKGRSLWADARRRFLRNRAAVAGLVVLAVVTLLSFGAPFLGLRAPDDINWDMISAPPDYAQGYYFGTDQNGRDLFVRTLYGGQVSLMVGLVATLVSLVIGTLWGASAGYLGGRIDNVMMRIVDILYSIPFVFFVILLTVAIPRNFIAPTMLMYLAIGAVSWLDMARIVRGQTVSIRRKEFIEAAHASGVSSWHIITRHIIPNCLGPVVVYMTLTVPAVILTESFISYLGMGVQEPDSSWGTLISEGVNAMEVAPWAVIYPSGVMVVTLLALNFVGDGLRDALDPKDR